LIELLFCCVDLDFRYFHSNTPRLKFFYQSRAALSTAPARSSRFKV
jgi:hypothetical protein